MSRHELAPSDPSITSVFVGWDRALGTYFAHIYCTGDDNPFDMPTLQIGDDFREVSNPHHAIGFVQDYAEVPAHLAATLTADAAHEGTCEAPAVLGILDAAQTPIDLDNVLCPF
ncbi:hypothetical protein [Paractinoplanes toevensis]|uniref:Uncharacterized protein n=1 Tax=Paractinoplanes toevensis TaxID=571911 RepID=A0A919WDG0_9ACTN|nr:hypothetical protein [Actinoplanes toevensis]GIM98065.1 hypothetical protein Ato02nite_098580 [Actinoplanes toevensis]